MLKALVTYQTVMTTLSSDPTGYASGPTYSATGLVRCVLRGLS